MKIYYYQGNIYFEGFGGKNFVIPNGMEGELLEQTMQAALDALHPHIPSCNCHLPQIWGHEKKCPEYDPKIGNKLND